MTLTKYYIFSDKTGDTVLITLHAENAAAAIKDVPTRLRKQYGHSLWATSVPLP